MTGETFYRLVVVARLSSRAGDEPATLRDAFHAVNENHRQLLTGDFTDPLVYLPDTNTVTIATVAN